MNGGTYAEAVKVGFHENAAGFLARFGAELRSEIIAEIDARQAAEHALKRAARTVKLLECARKAIDIGIWIAFGLMLGKVF